VLGIESQEDRKYVKIAGYTHLSHRSPKDSHFAKINLLSADFCEAHNFNPWFAGHRKVDVYFGKKRKVTKESKMWSVFMEDCSIIFYRGKLAFISSCKSTILINVKPCGNPVRHAVNAKGTVVVPPRSTTSIAVHHISVPDSRDFIFLA
jgi:hypothetical protein